ncbi:alpha/beta hydrolase [Mariniluteicoccus flavus]
MATTGSGESVAVLLHQTSGKGLCGMVPTARHLASKGVRAMLVEFCGYGATSCPDGVKGQQVAQVKAAVDHARAGGAKRVVLVGASMGGSVALRSATDVKADAVVDLSGVTTWGSECNLTADAKKATMPTLLAFSPEDAKDLANAKGALPEIPAAQKAVMEAPSGHGYSMLFGGPLLDQPTPVLERTTRWVKGDYA